MWTNVDRGEGVQKRDFFVDVINGWPLTGQQSLHCERNNIVLQKEKFQKDFNAEWVIICCLKLASIVAKSHENAE